MTWTMWLASAGQQARLPDSLTLLADVKLRPTPPHLRLMRRTLGDSSSTTALVNSLITASLASCFIEPR